MGVMYVGAALVILLINADKIGWAFGQILEGAFTGLGVAGGMVGALIQGFKRAAFSNEAGVGSAAIAHSAVRTKEPITEGFVSLAGAVHRHRCDLHHDSTGHHHYRSVDDRPGFQPLHG